MQHSALIEYGYRAVSLGLLAAILIRQEKQMSDIDTLNSEVAAVVADEASVKADIAKVLELLTAGTPDLSGAIALLQTLHTSLQADDASLVAAETPATPTAT